MPATRPARPKPRPQLIDLQADTPEAADRIITQLVSQVATVANKPSLRATVDLLVGENRVNHGLGVVPFSVILTPVVADASFGWAMTARDTKTLVITVVGVAMRAGLEIS